jgi:orotate phosphoribosyltransferase
MNRQELAVKIFDTAHLTGEFLLRSGKISNEYFDKYRFESDPHLLSEICDKMIDLIPAGTEILAGLEMGGIPIATILSQKTGLPAIFVRKEAKKYGTCKIAEGLEFKGKNVCIVEDVVTTGGQINLSAVDIRERGAVVDSVLCVIVREPKAYENLGEKGLKLLPLFSMEEIKQFKGI